MTSVVDFRKTDDPSDAIHRAVGRLVGGHLVAFPTETVYAACAHALAPSAVKKLASLQAQLKDAHPTLAIKGVQQAIDFMPGMDRLGQRLARRCWPGPVILAFDIPSELGLFQELPADTQLALAPDRRLWLRVPAHECVQEALRLMPGPLVAACERGKQGEPPITAKKLMTAYGDDIDLLIDDGECRYSEPATVVRVAGGSWSILRDGVVTKTLIGRLASEVFLFICTGNTCRSPLAEGFFRKMLAERLKCADDELSDRGFMVLSAGLAADAGLPASIESVEVAKRYGVDLRSHESQPASERLLEQADRILTMTRAHRDAILASHPQLANRVELLARDNSDITDPIGMGEKEYEDCRVEIERNLRAILDALPSEGAA